MNSRVSLLPLLAIAVTSARAQAPQVFIGPLPVIPRVRIGERSPSLDGAKWIKGAPVVTLGNGRVTVLDFWASWCPTCAETFDRVAELARKFRGRATFVGMSVWEHPEDVRNGSYVIKVRQFVAAKAASMPYVVATDDTRSTLANRWLGQNSGDIPKAFVIDRAGRVAWCGHPLADDFEDTINAVIVGRFDISRAMAEQAAQIGNAKELLDLVTPIQQAVQNAKWEDAVMAIDKAIQRNPSLEEGFGPTKFQMLLKYSEPYAYAYARDLGSGPCKDCAAALNLIAWTIVDDDSKLKNPDLATAITLAKRAYDLTDHQDAYTIDTLALALYKSGEKKKALDLQIAAVRIAEQMKKFDRKIMKDLRDRLALYRNTGGPPSP